MARNQSIDPSEALYTHADYVQLRTHRARLNKLLHQIDKAKACGIACDFIEQQRAEVDNQLAQIEQHFMTPPPAKGS